MVSCRAPSGALDEPSLKTMETASDGRVAVVTSTIVVVVVVSPNSQSMSLTTIAGSGRTTRSTVAASTSLMTKSSGDDSTGPRQLQATRSVGPTMLLTLI